MMGLISVALALLAPIQESPEKIVGADAPGQGLCIVCSPFGEKGPEKLVASYRFRGRVVSFCNDQEVKAFLADPASAMPPALPRPLPAVRLPEIGKQEIALPVQNQVSVMYFWATWCSTCTASMPAWNRELSSLSQQGAVTFAVSIDEDKNALDRYLKRRKPALPVLHDGSKNPLWTRLGIRSIPMTVVVNRAGQVVFQWTGKPNFERIRAAVKSAGGEATEVGRSNN